MLDLVGPEHLEAPVVARLRELDMSGSMGRVHLALGELPRFTARPHEGSGPADVHRAFSLLGADLDGYRRAHAAQLRGELPTDPVLELTMPSASDASLAPPGMHTATIGVQQLPRELASGSWDDSRERFADLVVDRLCEFAPNVRDAIVGRAIATPLDLERTFGLSGGNIFHGAMTERQLFERRPLAGWANYRTPITAALPVRSRHAPGRRRQRRPGPQRGPGDPRRLAGPARRRRVAGPRRGLPLHRAARRGAASCSHAWRRPALAAARSPRSPVARLARPLVHRLATQPGVVGD